MRAGSAVLHERLGRQEASLEEEAHRQCQAYAASAAAAATTATAATVAQTTTAATTEAFVRPSAVEAGEKVVDGAAGESQLRAVRRKAVAGDRRRRRLAGKVPAASARNGFPGLEPVTAVAGVIVCSSAADPGEVRPAESDDDEADEERHQRFKILKNLV